MSKKRAKRVLYPILVTTAWCLMAYSVLLGGFSTSLADYGSGQWDCPYPNGCASFGCNVQGSTATCSTYPTIPGYPCPSSLNCRKMP